MLDRLFGPLFIYEMPRLARGGRANLLRVCYASALVAGLCLVYILTFPTNLLLTYPFASAAVSINDRGRFGMRLVAALLAVQNLAVLVLTPAAVAPVLAGDRQRRTLALLYTTHLSSREILFGKLFPRLAFLATVLLSGLPILAMMHVWGGIDIGIVVAGCFVSLTALLSIGSLSMLIATNGHSVLKVTFFSYAASVYWASVSVLPGHIAIFTGDILLMLAFGFLHLLVSAIFLFFSVEGFRKRSLREPVVPRRAPRRHRRRIKPTTRRYNTLIDRNALLWKELHIGKNETRHASVITVTALVIGVGLAWLMIHAKLFALNPDYLIDHGILHFPRAEVEFLSRAGCVILLLFWVIATALRGGISVVREREQRTLTALLTLPVDRQQILRGKWLASILRYRQLGYALATITALGLITGWLQPLWTVTLIFSGALLLAMIASLSVCISVLSGSTAWANVGTGVLLLGILLLGWWIDFWRLATMEAGLHLSIVAACSLALLAWLAWMAACLLFQRVRANE